MKNGLWEKQKYKGIEISGKTLGIIGLGRIGHLLGKKAQSLGMNVIFYDKYLTCHEDFKYKNFEKLLSTSDFVSLHIPSQTLPLIGINQLKLMKKTAFIINTSRGILIDESAILHALNNNIIAGAGLDVFEKEPTCNIELIKHPKVSASPHIAGSTIEAQEKIGLEIIDIVEEFGGSHGNIQAL